MNSIQSQLNKIALDEVREIREHFTKLNIEKKCGLHIDYLILRFFSDSITAYDDLSDVEKLTFKINLAFYLKHKITE